MTLPDASKWFLVVIGGIFTIFFLAGISGFFCYFLWNWLVPSIFGLRSIDFWEAWGLCWLFSLLFKSSGSSK